MVLHEVWKTIFKNVAGLEEPESNHFLLYIGAHVTPQSIKILVIFIGKKLYLLFEKCS